jgi:signal peptidase I
MMGDNRHNSSDCRVWGFVPEDHVVGKAWMVWLSLDSELPFPKRIRWNRSFKMIK